MTCAEDTQTDIDTMHEKHVFPQHIGMEPFVSCVSDVVGWPVGLYKPSTVAGEILYSLTPT